MRWPCVSRAAHEDQLRFLRAQIADLRADVRALREERDSALAREREAADRLMAVLQPKAAAIRRPLGVLPFPTAAAPEELPPEDADDEPPPGGIESYLQGLSLPAAPDDPKVS